MAKRFPDFLGSDAAQGLYKFDEYTFIVVGDPLRTLLLHMSRSNVIQGFPSKNKENEVFYKVL